MYASIGAVNITAGYLVWGEWTELQRRDRKAAGSKSA